ncbi:MAG: hypothetical protein Q7T59_01485 [Candidatus Woesebacteria bacterium]|nr:hypothetical protein [Candidatus Woesebacteria bacterium]
MPEIQKDPNAIDSHFQLCSFQGTGTDCNNNDDNIPSGASIRELTKTRECKLDCNNRSQCTHFQEK